MFSTMIENRITGFEFYPEFEKDDGVELLKALKIEFLEKGRVISETTIENVKKEEAERLQEQLLYNVIMNLNITKDRNEAEKLAKKAKTLGIVNMFKIQSCGENGIVIDFIKSGSFAVSSQITNVSESELKVIEDILSDNTETNLKCTRQCEAVTFLDLLAVIDQRTNK